MKNISETIRHSLRTLLAFLLATLVFTASAQPRFQKISEFENFNYSYISPAMLKAMGDNYYETEGFRVPFKQLDSVETISTMVDGTNDRFWETIRQVIKDERMESLTTNKIGINRTDFLGRLNGNQLQSVMLITQHGGNWVSVSYIKGVIMLNSLEMNF